MNKNPLLTAAGIWIPVDLSYLSNTNNGNVIPIAGLVKTNPYGQYSVVLNGWGWQGGFGGNSTAPERISIGLLTPDTLGGLKLNTSLFISDALTNGGNSVVVADFNADGKDDIFLAAHNESPFVSTSSTVYLSNSLGAYTKVTLSDNVMAHDAELAYIAGKPTVVTTTYQPGDANHHRLPIERKAEA